ncbi:MAG: DNRLRE domain-containing protein [Deltaproteobacteria bacterium]|nr:DNRLRE domain-containing protein [Deltaproteobacteria bacterium]
MSSICRMSKKSGRAGTGLASLLLFALVAGTAWAGDSVTIVADRDNTLFETVDGSTSSGDGADLFLAGPGGPLDPSKGLRRVVLHFDMGSIPSGYQVLSVDLRLTVNKANFIDSVPVSVHRVTSDWGEGLSDAQGSGLGDDAEMDDATWLHTFYSDAFWSSPGGDFVSSPSATAEVGGGFGAYYWSSPALVADVKGWIESGNNYGWLLSTDLEDAGRRFASRENGTPGDRPTLIVYVPEPAAASLGAAAVVAIALLRRRHRVLRAR